MGLVARVYEADGTLVRQLQTSSIVVAAQHDNISRRTAQLRTAASDLEVLQVPNRQVRIYDSTNLVFVGWTDTSTPIRYLLGSTSAEITLLDKTQRARLDGWQVDTTYEDTTAVQAIQLAQRADGSTFMAVGAEIQSQALTYGRLLYATVAGIESQVTPESESGSIVVGNYSVGYTASGLSNLRLVINLDFQVQESVATVVATTSGTATIESSLDGVAWVPYVAGTWRYLRITVNQSSGPITLGVVATTGSDYPASNVLIDDDTTWRPTLTDLDINIIIDLEATLDANIAKLRLGYNNFALTTCYDIHISRSLDGVTWTPITDIVSAGLEIECPFDTVALRFLRITFHNWYGPRPGVRYVFIGESTWDPAKEVTLSDIIADIAASWGEPLTNIAHSHVLVPAVTFERGQNKWASILSLAAVQGWEVWYDREGYLRAGPTEWNVLSPVVAIAFESSTIEVEWNYDLVYNVILAENGNSSMPLISSAVNDGAWSSTSTVKIGVRTSPVLSAPLAVTQEQLDRFTQHELQRYNRPGMTIQVNGVVASQPSIVTIEPGDIVTIPYQGSTILASVVDITLRSNGPIYNYELVVTPL